jgi:hypothetical protein
MNKTQLLRTLVVANVLLAFASVGGEAFFAWTLPPALADYTHARFSDFSVMSAGGGLQFLLLATGTLCAFGAWIGLLNYWRFSRRLLLISLAITLLHVLLAGPSVRTSVSVMFSLMSSVVGGAILGLVYFSELARRFEIAPVESTASAGVSLGADRA